VNRTRSALLWGLVGALTFLVLVQGYRLFVGQLRVDFLGALGIALVLGSVVSAVSYLAEPRLAAKGRS
jgi:hypothetical protein